MHVVPHCAENVTTVVTDCEMGLFPEDVEVYVETMNVELLEIMGLTSP